MLHLLVLRADPDPVIDLEVRSAKILILQHSTAFRVAGVGTY